MKVFKFGGSSVGSPQRIKGIIELLRSAVASDCRAVVFSAFQGVTDHLIEVAELASVGRVDYTDLVKSLEQRHIDAVRELVDIHLQSSTIAQVKMLLNDLDDILQGIFLIKELSPRSRDFILSFGERLSALIVSRALTSAGVDNEFLDARQVIRTDNKFGSAAVIEEKTHALIQAHFAAHAPLQIVTGFIAATEHNETTTLGRGGSDYTASIFGAALNADEVQIWTDVDGVLTADPRKVGRAFPVSSMTYEEALEMSHFGAKVIYPPTIQPLMVRSIPIRIMNTFNPTGKGTLISADAQPGPYAIKGISSIDDVSLIKVQGAGMVGVAGVAHRIFGAMARHGISVILISQASSEYSVCFAVRPEDAMPARALLVSEFETEIRTGKISEVTIEDQLCILAIVGENMRATPGIAASIFRALGNNGVNISAIAQGSSELNISVVIAREDERKALTAIHDSFFLSGLKTLHVFVFGAGAVGSALVDMIRRQRKELGDSLKLDLRVVGVANSRKMYFDLNGIDDAHWKESLMSSGGPSTLDGFIEHMRHLNLPNSVFVDCTSSPVVAERYVEVLESSISVVTASKKAASGPMELYEAIHEAARENHVCYHYETNVGAALPVIRMVRDVRQSGDRLNRIEALMSGTTNYILDSLMQGGVFSEIVAKAKELGYTEPDPRDDLNGMDIARKILILAREAGYSLELGDVNVSRLLPELYYQAGSVDEFMTSLKQLDAAFTSKRNAAQSENKALRYIARFEQGRASVSLETVGPEHPAYGMRDTDSMLLLYTETYGQRPMVLSGPGAGPEITARGVLADIIAINKTH